MELLMKIVTGFSAVNYFCKSSIFGVWEGPEYASAVNPKKPFIQRFYEQVWNTVLMMVRLLLIQKLPVIYLNFQESQT